MIARTAALVLLATHLTASAMIAEEKGKITMETVEYGGWKHNLKISNGEAELIVTLDVGPRVISYSLANNANVFKEFSEQLGRSGEPTWQVRGGHRLWTAPEDLTRTYALDNEPVEAPVIRDNVALIRQRPDSAHGIQKEIEIKFEPKGSRARVTHRIQNIGTEPVELAVWALTVMAPGGVEIIPMPPGRPHPGDVANARSPEDFAPDRNLVLWPFFDFSDPRWTFGSKFLMLRQDPTLGPTKLGLANRVGWAAYLNDGTLFVKRTKYQEGARYPDRGASYETFSNQDMLEMESLSPLVKLAPGASVEHTEQWELFGNLGVIDTEGRIEREIVPRLTPR